MTSNTTLLAAALSVLFAGAAVASERPQSLLEALAKQGAPKSTTPMALGEPGGNLVVNPVTPCRLFDTRAASPRGGALQAQQSRAFFAFGQDFSATQGGAEGDCGIGDDLEVEAIIINLTLVNPLAAGFATAWPMGESLPLAATLSYATGQTVTNEVIVPINADPGNEDFQLYSFRQAHAVADIVGYLSRPEATALDCELGPMAEDLLPAGTFYAVKFAPTCPDGRSAVTVLCDAGGRSSIDGFGVIPGYGAVCAYSNNTAVNDVVFTAATCCRVPGR